MRPLSVLGFSLWISQLFLATPVLAADLSTCGKAQLLAYSPDEKEVVTHRQFSLPLISYPFAQKQNGNWGLFLTLRVDEHGQVVCYGLKDDFDKDQQLNGERRAVIARAKYWRYTPFVRNGKAVAAILSEQIYEQELPEAHLPLPQVPLNEVHISLTRSGCFGSCPSYKIDVYGDGRAVYEGRRFVDVDGEHSYQVPPNEVRDLVETLRATDIWSFRTAYRASITDNPNYTLVIDMGGQKHSLDDYVGDRVGMPAAVTKIEEEVDKVARSEMWLHLSLGAIDRLKIEQFDFKSQASADLLVRALANEYSRDDSAMLSLIKLGAPVADVKPSESGFYKLHDSALEAAFRNHRTGLIDALVAGGALMTAGKPDHEKIDSAFHAAISSGRLALVEKAWEAGGGGIHPALTFDDVSDSDKAAHKEVPVVLLLSRAGNGEGYWQGLEIVKWLKAQGCDIKASAADGTTLLHIAAKAGDVGLVRYLLDQGMDASTPGEYGLPALGSTYSEDVALMLLEARTSMSRMDDSGHQFRHFAESNHWQRVVDWLIAHDL
jgi:ankyrin repeat protein